MDIEIKALTQEQSGDYFRFFDEVAFSDHGEWAGCYCMFFHIDPAKDEDFDLSDIAERRATAQSWVRDGIIRGYLAYVDGNVVGWCNAGDKTGFRRLAADRNLWPEGDTQRIKSVVCFLIAPEQRGKGIAAKLLDRVCRDAAEAGYTCVEGYPVDGELDSFKHYHGHTAMFEKAGFEVYRKFGGYSVMRKSLA